MVRLNNVILAPNPNYVPGAPEAEERLWWLVAVLLLPLHHPENMALEANNPVTARKTCLATLYPMDAFTRLMSAFPPVSTLHDGMGCAHWVSHGLECTKHVSTVC